jgi:DNA-binding CsgD family transcriptional regulator
VIPRALALSHTGASELMAGLLRESERCFDQLSAIAEASGRQEHIGALLIAAWRGDAGLTRRLGDDVSREATAQGQGYQLTFAGYARLILELGLGRYRDAYLALGDDIGDISHVKFALAHAVEAATRCGEREGAERFVGMLGELAAAHPVPRTCGDLARARALLSQDKVQADGLYQEAIALHEDTRGPAHLARSHQLYGEWLRRSRQMVKARNHLRLAYDLFEDMGAHAFADRTAAELGAAGDPVSRRAGREDAAELTPQEARVAHLAAGGATNTEIAAQLYLSVNTVDYHLRKVYRKLGLSSRRELRDRVDEPSHRPSPSARP